MAKEIADKVNGIYLDKDYARTLVYENEKIDSVQQPEDILDEYMPTVFEKLTQVKNGLIILDASVDRKFDEYKKWADENGYKVFVISVEVDRDIAEEAIRKERDGKTAEWFISQYDRWYGDHEKFLISHQPDFTIQDLAEKDKVIESLKRQLS